MINFALILRFDHFDPPILFHDCESFSSFFFLLGFNLSFIEIFDDVKVNHSKIDGEFFTSNMIGIWIKLINLRVLSERKTN